MLHNKHAPREHLWCSWPQSVVKCTMVHREFSPETQPKLKAQCHHILYVWIDIERNWYQPNKKDWGYFMSSQRHRQQVYTRAYLLLYLVSCTTRMRCCYLLAIWCHAPCLMSQDIRVVLSKGFQSRVVDSKLLLWSPVEMRVQKSCEVWANYVAWLTGTVMWLIGFRLMRD